MRSVRLSVPDKSIEELDTFAKVTGWSRNDIVEEALGLYLWDAQFREVKSRLQEKAKTEAILTEEVVLKTIS